MRRLLRWVGALAALAIEHGLVLCSTDGDFAKFPGLTWENPLGAAGRVTNAAAPTRGKK